MAARDRNSQDVADPLRSHPSAEAGPGSSQTVLQSLGPLSSRNLSGGGAYQPVPSATAPLESIALEDNVPPPASPPLAPNELGILSRADTMWPSVTAVSGAETSINPTESPPLTGASLGGFSVGSSTGSSAAASPRTGLLSRKKRRQPTTLLERVRTAFTRPYTSSTQAGSEPLRTSVGYEGPQGVSNYSDEEAAAGHGLEQDGDAGNGEKLDGDAFRRKFAEPPVYCISKRNLRAPSRSFRFNLFLSFASFFASGVWLAVAIFGPRYNRYISANGILPTTATVLATTASKMIELVFAAVVVSFVGQVLSRRSVDQPLRGMTLAEMTRRNWVSQPGAIITDLKRWRSFFSDLMSPLCLVAAIAAMLYTPASEALVSPKLRLGKWESSELVGLVRSSYANSMYAKMNCPYLFLHEADKDAPESCLNVQFSGESYRNLQGYMRRWMSVPGSGSGGHLAQRPVGTTLLYDNTTMTGAWIEREHANVTRQFEEHGRIVNNVTMAMPHPGVYAAATNRGNAFLQPDELDNMGEYAIRASVVSPTINVMCVSMARDELAPLVYTEWPRSRTELTGVGSQLRGRKGWADDVPRFVQGPGARYLNRTKVDDIFRWGPMYGRWPPVFQLYPADYNLAINASGVQSDSLYLLAKKVNVTGYTLCEMRSWLSPSCSTHFNISGAAGATMRAHCEDPEDPDVYHRQAEDGRWGEPDKDWKYLAEQWRLSMDLNGGSYNNNASNARILTQLALDEAKLPPNLPSLAEALAVFGSSMLMLGSVDTPFRHNWTYDAPNNILEAPGSPQIFKASIISKAYQSGRNKQWKRAFFAVLVPVPIISLGCFAYFLSQRGMMTDFTEPVNAFTLAINSPPSSQIKGSCGGGPRKHHYDVPWRVSHVEEANHYFFESARETP